MLNFMEKKAQKDGIITPKAILEHALEHVDIIEEIIICVKTKNGEYDQSISLDTVQKTVGLLEISKHIILNNSYEK